VVEFALVLRVIVTLTITSAVLAVAVSILDAFIPMPFAGGSHMLSRMFINSARRQFWGSLAVVASDEESDWTSAHGDLRLQTCYGWMTREHCGGVAPAPRGLV
jgi:hypothetical protein